MKKKLHVIFTVAALLSAAVLSDVEARRLSPEEALQRVASTTMKKISADSDVPIKLVYSEETPATRETALYVFDSGKSGYMILTADDSLTPMLGYNESGSFDPWNIPPALKYWLSEYARQIEYFYSLPESACAYQDNQPRMAARQAITPLVTTKWNQFDPYNNLCPVIGSERTVTGCVATAMAQIMKFHQYPAKGTGQNSYEWTAGGKTLSYDFSSVTFDWANMVDNYTSSSTAAQNSAVANLMYACGMGVDMNYDVASKGGSGAISYKIPKALIDYFGYKQTAIYIMRDQYSVVNDWETLIYEELSAGRPVNYSGRTSENEGHQFVCDGYDGNGYFHINWGWGGLSDGYYLLNALDPGQQGAGGASSNLAFNYNQAAVVGVMPPSTESKVYDPFILSSGNLTESHTNSVITLSLTGSDWWNAFFNYNMISKTVYAGARFVSQADNSEFYIFSNTESTFEGVDESYHGLTALKIPYNISDIKAGKYTVYPVVKYEGETFPIYPYLESEPASVEIEFTGEVAEEAVLRLNRFEPETDIMPGQNTTFYASFANEGNADYSDKIYIWLLNDNMQYLSGVYYNLSLTAGKTTNYRLTMSSGLDVEPGYYYYEVTDVNDQELGLYRFFIGRKVTKVSMEKTEHSVVLSQEPFQLNVAIEPEDAHLKDLEWTSSDEKVATVDSNGVVTPVGEGTTEIKAATTDSSGLHDVCLLTVSPEVPTMIYEIVNESQLVYDVYTLTGVKVGSDMTTAQRAGLAPGIYIFVRNGISSKRIVK